MSPIVNQQDRNENFIRALQHFKTEHDGEINSWKKEEKTQSE